MEAPSPSCECSHPGEHWIHLTSLFVPVLEAYIGLGQLGKGRLSRSGTDMFGSRGAVFSW